MEKKPCSHILAVLVFLTIGVISAQEVSASKPNIVLSRAVHFRTPGGQSVAVSPGKYFVEQGGARDMRLRREGGTEVIDLLAELLTHEQYELFSAMAMTRPGENDLFYVDLLMPGGIRLQAVGSTSAPEPSMPVVSTPAIPLSPPDTSSPPTVMVPPTPQRPSMPAAPTTAPFSSMSAPPPTPPSQAFTTPPSVTSPQPLTPPPIPQGMPEPPARASIPEPAPRTPETVEPELAYLPPTAPVPGIRVDGVKTETSTDLPNLFVLAPDHIGLTIHEQPTLYWYLTESTDEPIDVMMTEEETLRVILDVRLLPPLPGGIQSLSLKDYDVRLLKNVPYQWEAKIRAKTLTEVVKASGFIMRVEPPRALATVSAPELRSPEAPKLYAKSGLWYDAFGALSDLIRSHPESEALLKQRNLLLKQVGLTEVAKSSLH